MIFLLRYCVQLRFLQLCSVRICYHRTKSAVKKCVKAFMCRITGSIDRSREQNLITDTQLVEILRQAARWSIHRSLQLSAVSVFCSGFSCLCKAFKLAHIKAEVCLRSGRSRCRCRCRCRSRSRCRRRSRCRI